MSKLIFIINALAIADMMKHNYFSKSGRTMTQFD